MRKTTMIAMTGGLAMLALTGCEQNTTVPEAEATETMMAEPMPAAESTTVITTPGPTETMTETASPMPDGPSATMTMGPTPSATMTAN